LQRIPGVASPAGLGIDPNLGSLYVSNFDQGTIQRIGANPQQIGTFHTVVNTINVGAGPRAVSVQPANEDVLVALSGENALSIIDVPSQSERTRLPVGNGPRDIFVTDRFICAGCTLAYMAFVTNFFDDTVSVYESDSPNPQVSNGPDGKIIDTVTGFSGPSYGTWNRYSSIGFSPAFMGAYVVNSLGNDVTQLAATNFGLNPVPGFPGPPGFRTLTVSSQFSAPQLGAPGDATIENLSALSVPPQTGDQKWRAKADIGAGQGVPSVLLVTYPASGQVAAFDINTGGLFGSVAAPGTLLFSHYDQ